MISIRHNIFNIIFITYDKSQISQEKNIIEYNYYRS